MPGALRLLPVPERVSVLAGDFAAGAGVQPMHGGVHTPHATHMGVLCGGMSGLLRLQ